MLIILSQKIDTSSVYSDEVFTTYHYPSRYRNQIHEGDTFVYYQGNRYVKDQRYYFGVGTVGKISTLDGDNYYAELINGQKFKNKVPIYLPDGKYVEELGYDTIRKSPTPPWQSSVRPLSQQAFDYIIAAAGVQLKPETSSSVEELRERLKSQVRAFYLDNDINAILEIKSTASEIINALNLAESTLNRDIQDYIPITDSHTKVQDFLNYCETTRITYSYKPVLIMAFFKCANKKGVMKMSDGIECIKKYYENRRKQGQIVEKKKSIYLNANVTDEEVRQNLIANPIKAITESGFFFFNQENQELIFSPELWPSIGRSEKIRIRKICSQRLAKYYGE